MLSTPELQTVTAEAAGEHAIKFTFPDGRAFVREDIRHVLSWIVVTDVEEGVARVELQCRDEYARWVTVIMRNRAGAYEEYILLPRFAHGEMPRAAEESVLADGAAVPSESVGAPGHHGSPVPPYRIELPLLVSLP